MSKWQKVKLGDVCEQINGVSYKPDDVSETLLEHYIPVLRAHNIQDDGLNADKLVYVREEIVNPRQIIINDDIIICASSGSKNLVGKAAQSNKSSRVSFGAFCKAIRPKNINGKYLGHFFQTPKYRQIISGLSAGANINNLRKEDIASLEIPLPPLEEQKRIADILDKASNLVELRKQQLEKMDLLIKSKFIDMFGDPVTNPKGWEVKRIEELCESIFGGGTPSKSHAEYYDGDIPWVTSKDMKSILISDSIDHINDKAVLNSSAKYIPKQSLLMVIRSGILKHTLPLGINTRVVTINQDMKAFIPNANINVWFMFYTFKMHERSLLNNVRAVTADNIEFSIIRNLMVPVPSLELQNQFAEFVEQVEKQKVVMQQSLGKMEMNYKALMQEYFG